MTVPCPVPNLPQVGLGANNTVLAVGGILAYLKGQPDINFFNVSNATNPTWIASADPPLVGVWRRMDGCRLVPDRLFFAVLCTSHAALALPCHPCDTACLHLLQSAVTDSFSAQSDGGFWVSQMGDANGGSPGRMVRLGPAPNFAVVGEYPSDASSIPADFNPHGFAIDTTVQRMVTAGVAGLEG